MAKTFGPAEHDGALSAIELLRAYPARTNTDESNLFSAVATREYRALEDKYDKATASDVLIRALTHLCAESYDVLAGFEGITRDAALDAVEAGMRNALNGK